jgi:hypothetical protein
MTDKQLEKLVSRKVQAATRLRELREQLDPEIEKRYGTHPGEIDCDPAIDALDYGLTYGFTLSDLDREMAACGHAAKSANDPSSATAAEKRST